MTTWYVHGLTGSDAASGLTSALAKKTLAAALAAAADGGTILCAESMREKGVATTLNGIVIKQEAGQSQAILRGDTLVTGSWTDTTDGAHTTPVAEVNGLTGVVVDYDLNIDSGGRHYGHLAPAASVAACKLTDNSWFHDTAADLLYVRIGANQSPTLIHTTVGYCDVLGKNLISFTGCVSPVIDGLYFWLNPRTTDTGDSYLFYFDNCTDPVAKNYRCQDGGKHNEDVNDCLGMPVLENGVTGGVGPGGTLTVFGSITALRPIYGRVRNVSYFGHYYLGLDGLEIATSAGSIMAYQHPSSGGPVTDVQYQGCTFTGITGFGKWQNIGYDVGVDVADGSRWTASAYPVQVIGGSTIGPNIEVHPFRSIAFVRHKFLGIQSRQGNASGGGIVLDGTGSGSASLLLECCVIVGDLTQGTNTDEGVLIWSNDGNSGHKIILNNCTVIDTSTQTPGALRYLYHLYGGTDLEARRCIFTHKTSHANNTLANYDDDVVTVVDVKDCLYENMTTYSIVATRDTFAEWLATMDSTARELATTPFLSWNTGVPDQAHSSFRFAATNTEHLPLMGVDGKLYCGKYGAFQSRGDMTKLNRARGTRLKRV